MNSIPKNGRVGVLGAGVSGLSYAFFLSKLRPDVRITLYERSFQAGGYINTAVESANGDKVTVEKGPRTLRGISEGSLMIVDMLRLMGKEDIIEVMQLSSPANRKFLLGRNGQLLATPSGFNIETLKFILGDLGEGLLKGILGEPFRRKQQIPMDESVEDFVKRRFGSNKISENMLSGVFRGIYAGDVGKLSVNLVAPALKFTEQIHGLLVRSMGKNLLKTLAGRKLPLPPASKAYTAYETLINPEANFTELGLYLRKFPMYRLRGGLQQFPLLLAEHLENNVPNVEIKYNTEVKEVDVSQLLIDGVKYDHIRSTLPVHLLEKLLVNDTNFTNLRELLQQLHYVSITLVNVYSKKTKLTPEAGFGFLVPKAVNTESSYNLLGVIYDSDIEKHVIPFVENGTKQPQDKEEYSKVTMMFGGYLYDLVGGPPNQRALQKVIKDVLNNKLNVDMQKHKLTGPEGNGDIIYTSAYNDKCIPQFNVGYEELKRKVLTSLPDNLTLGGMAFGRGIGVPDCVRPALESVV